jgi:hypothetical protein
MGTMPRATGDADVATVGFNNLPGLITTQTNTGQPLIVAVAQIEPEKMLTLVFGHAFTVVAEGKTHHITFGLGREGEGNAWGIVVEGVAQKVVEYLLDVVGVSPERRQGIVAFQVQNYLMLFTGRSPLVANLLQKGLEWQRLGAEM